MTERDITLAQKFLKCFSGMELSVYKEGRESMEPVTAPLSTNEPWNLFTQEAAQGLKQLLPGCVYEVSLILDVRYLIIFDGESGEYLAAGPCVLERLHKPEIIKQLREYGISAQLDERILALYGGCPQLSFGVFYQLGTLLAQWFLETGEDVPHQQINYQWNRMHPSVFYTDQYVDLVQMRSSEQRHENSAALTEAVKHGNLSMAYSFMNQIKSGWHTPSDSADPLRSRKNICIALNTQLRNAAEEAGLHSVILDLVFGDILLGIESLGNTDDVDQYSDEVIRSYCELVRDHAYTGLKPIPHLAVTYIKDHLNENLTVRDTAKALMVNPDYLSSCFHKEVGMTFIDFVNQERTAQAAGLLRNTTLQIKEIASVVGYNNTSYFARQFLRYYHLSPRDYRANHMMAPKPSRQM